MNKFTTSETTTRTRTRNLLLGTLLGAALVAPCARAHHAEGRPPVPTATLEELDFALREIPAGSFTMGSPGSEDGRDGDEGQEKVEITRDFLMAATETTQRQWALIMGGNPSRFSTPEDCDNHGTVNGAGVCPDLPVERVSWEDVQEYHRKLNAMFNPGSDCDGTPESDPGCFRLPTEAEWEYAARAGTGTAYHFGDSPGDLGGYAWYGENSGGRTRPVATRWENPLGLHDMHGNVWEWTRDGYRRELSGGKDPLRDSGANRVIRGGGWSGNARSLRSANRSGGNADRRLIVMGFRSVRTK